jgi:hypothetical protein
MKKTLVTKTLTSAPSTALITAASITGHNWLYVLAVATALLPSAITIIWRYLFATRPASVRRDLLSLARIEQDQ